MLWRSPTLADIERVAMKMREDDRREIYNVIPGDYANPFALSKFLKGVLDRGNFGCCACLDENTPVCVLGWTELHPGVMEAWAFATDDFSKLSTPLTKFVRQQLRPSLLSNLGIHRMQAISRHDHVQAHRWLAVLGFRQEAVLKHYGRDGSDYFMFRATRSDSQCAS